MSRRRWWVGALLALTVTSTGMVAAGTSAGTLAPTDARWGDGGVSDFYRWTNALPALPGVMLRHEVLALESGLDKASHAQRILYSSTDGINGKQRISVSGAVYFPKGKPPAGGWPVIAWAHGTTGVADVCAPSWRGNADERQQYLNTWLSQGYAVVASDYQGLGTPGPHPYMHPQPEGFSILDALRASLKTFPELANKVVGVGQSQGSGAALAAAQLAPDYAPDIHYLGTVATGLVPELAHADGAPQLTLPSTYSYADSEEAAFATIYLLGSVRALYPELPVDTYFSVAGKGLEEVGLHQCFPEAVAYARQHDMSLATLYAKSVKSLEAETGRRTEVTSAHIATPVFTGTGLNDQLMEPAYQYNFIASMCHEGTPVAWHVYPGLDHMTAVNGSLKDSEPFVRQVFTGVAVQSNCPGLKPEPWSSATARHYAH